MSKYKYQPVNVTNGCQISCLSMVYEYYGIAKSQEDIYCDLVKMKGFDNNGTVPTYNIVNHIHKYSFLSACNLMATDTDKIFNFAADNNLSMILHHRMRFSDGYHATLFDYKENDLIYGLDPTNEDLYPINIKEFKELWKYYWSDYSLMLIGNNDNDFFEATATCGHKFKAIKIPENIAEFVRCPHCHSWRRMSKMNSENVSINEYDPIVISFDMKMIIELKEKFESLDNLLHGTVDKVCQTRNKVQKEAGVELPLVHFKDEAWLDYCETALLIKGCCIEKILIDINAKDIAAEFEKKVTECFDRNIQAILKAFRK